MMLTPRLAIIGSPTMVGHQYVPVTISLGVAERRPKETRDQLISRADEALYRAKRSGRDRVELASGA